MPDEKRLDEQAISKVAETLLSSQINEAQKLEVDIRTDPLKMVGGTIDSVAIAGKNLVTQQDLSVQEIELHTDSVDLNSIHNGQRIATRIGNANNLNSGEYWDDRFEPKFLLRARIIQQLSNLPLFAETAF
jgi:hypothetical protein